ncbi:2Fe-2S iron-sulfur cluster binding domain-containing protein [Lentibacillus daqui]|uniref:2Fe-2S iron-sulfur cluster binding domain-containing protein n=1 Tax=Lentibacillus daqui TaxID=2911514 RepID=UPI0022B169A9|nr:2Fe-2S iron-sulfur cluster binding domain-containing protein [Lentibacillus daqui]
MREYVVTVQNTDVSFEVQDGETILTAARKQGVWPQFECGWGSCGTCKATLVDGQVKNLLPDAPALTKRDSRKNRIILCQSIPESDVTLKARLLEEPEEHLTTADYNAVVTDVKLLTDEIALIRLGLNRPAPYQPGQYAILNLGGGLRRCYSMSNLPGGHELEFIVRRYPNGPGSQTMHTLTPGMELTLELPYGAAFVRETKRPKIFVAGGTGISAILCMVRQMSLWGDSMEQECMMFYGARTPNDLVLMDEINELFESIKDGSIIPVVDKADEDWDGEVGFVNNVVGDYINKPWDQYEFYIAGPPVMVQAMRKLLGEREVDVTRVHYDSFG